MNISIEDLVVLYAVLLFSLCVHEFAHAWAANMCGDDTARLMGRMTLNPLVHIDPVGTVIFPLLALVMAMKTGTLFLFGWAKPVPVNPGRFGNYKRDDILVSLAGIICNLLLALFAATTLRTIYAIGPFPFRNQAAFILLYLMQINVILGVFNLIPVPPLDGSHVLYHFLPPETARKFHQLQQYGFVILILLLMSGVLWRVIDPFLRLFRMIAGLPV